MRGLRPRVHAAAAPRPVLPVPVAQPRSVRRLRVLPGQRLYRASFAGAQGVRPRVLDQPRVPALPDVPRRRSCSPPWPTRPGTATSGTPGSDPAGRGPRLAVHAAEPRRRPQRAGRDLDAVLRDGLLPAARRAVQLGRAPAQRLVRDGLRGRRGRARRRASDVGARPLVERPRAGQPAGAQRGHRRADPRRPRARRAVPVLGGQGGSVARGRRRPRPRHVQPELPLPVVRLRDPGADVHRHADLPGRAGAGSAAETAGRASRFAVGGARRCCDGSRGDWHGGALRVSLAGPVDDVGAARRAPRSGSAWRCGGSAFPAGAPGLG